MQAEMALAMFEDRFGRPATHIAFAPGRINLIGEHTDYSLGFVMPLAIPYGVTVVFAASDGPSHLQSIARGSSKPFTLEEIEPGTRKGWSNYAAGMAWALRARGHAITRGMDAVVDTNLPIGSGVSSSAALEVAFGLAWTTANGLELDPLEIARTAQHCENQFVGVNCGLMDMAASALGQEGHALLMDIRSMEVTPIPMPEETVVILCDTGKSRGLATSHYNTRREEVARACAALGRTVLRDATLQELETVKGRLDNVAFRRARHVITENGRTLEFAEALYLSDRARIHRLMNEAHASIRDDFEASCPELDAMAAIAESHPACWGARMTGGGFGGACVALVTEQDVPDFVNTTNEAYRNHYPDQPSRFLVCEASSGASVHKIGI
jgi:galactokinase